MAGEVVVVTGASGFVGKYTVADLLRAGYRVRGTVRSLAKGEALRPVIDRLVGRPAGDDLELVEADILHDSGWGDIMTGATAIMHVATVILGHEPADPAEVVRPAVEGTERILRFAAQTGVKRVILTSSIATVGYGLGHTSGTRVFTEADFTNLEAMEHAWAYCVGKTRAERAAWSFARATGLELTTIHPGAILGPASDPSTSISLNMVINLLNGNTKAVINTGFSIIDVRDVAALHVAALQDPRTIGERFLATAQYTRFETVARILRENYPEYDVTDRVIPDDMLLSMLKDGSSKAQIVNDLGNEKHFSGAKGEALLGRPFVTSEQAILAAASTSIDFGLVSRAAS